ncbi:MAG: dihydrofolate reductase [Bacteroidetes bacterium]|nr:dihydrofolate reductase [Bacteroidota bacterium]HMU13070.1 dihydrofolate reductase [Flavobacteriales bacterium]
MRTRFPAVSALLLLLTTPLDDAFGQGKPIEKVAPSADFQWEADRFGDVRVLRYRIPGWEQLSLKEKVLAYHLSMAGLAGRDIMWDQNCRHNLVIRKALGMIIQHNLRGMDSPEWPKFMEYAKQVYFSNGIHHHYGMDKFIPDFSRDWFEKELAAAGGKRYIAAVSEVMFNPAIAAKKVSLDASRDLLGASAVNFYGEGVTDKVVERFYASMKQPDPARPLSFGLNSRLEKEGGTLKENVWKVDGLYGSALREVNAHLTKAMEFACNEKQKAAIGLLIKFFATGDLKTWDDFNVAWVEDTESTVDFILGFVEVYNDPLGKRGSFESIVEVIDPVATRNMRVIQDNAQWFEDNSPLLPAHKKAKVTGITYKFVNAAGEAGDAAPSTPIGVNLPNADWIRAEHGSKSVSLGNITDAYEQSGGKSALEVFCNDPEEVERAIAQGGLAGELHTALHEVIGHASGQLEPGVEGTDVTLKNYASTLEEGRADLVALYFLMDPKLVELGVMPSLETGKAEYDSYLRNGLLAQLRRIKPGNSIEEAHMRNRQWVSAWVVERGLKNGAVARNERNGDIYYDILDYEKMRSLFGELLREVQRIKSQGDYEAGKALVETYGVKVDPKVHANVLARAARITVPPYAGFIQPRLVPVMNASGQITDVRVEYPGNFLEQMLEYDRDHSFLPEQILVR